jgi:hypothetical protein
MAKCVDLRLKEKSVEVTQSGLIGFMRARVYLDQVSPHFTGIVTPAPPGLDSVSTTSRSLSKEP